MDAFKTWLLSFPIVRQLNSYRVDRNPNAQHLNIVLHGCCLIFTPKFFDKLSGFDSRTFLFREEELLTLMLRRNGLTNIYCPQISVTHLEDAATNTVVHNREQKNDFTRKYQAQSLKILIDEMKKGKKCK